MKNRVAGDTIAYCTSCRMDLLHVIVAMDGDRILRVICKSCKKEHSFRPPAGLKAIKGTPADKRKRATPSTPRKKSTSAAREWEKAMELSRDLPAITYVMEGSFKEGEKIDHAKFGPGIVRKLIKPDKMEVVFRDEIRTLVRNFNRSGR